MGMEVNRLPEILGEVHRHEVTSLITAESVERWVSSLVH